MTRNTFSTKRRIFVTYHINHLLTYYAIINFYRTDWIYLRTKEIRRDFDKQRNRKSLQYHQIKIITYSVWLMHVKNGFTIFVGLKPFMNSIRPNLYGNINHLNLIHWICYNVMIFYFNIIIICCYMYFTLNIWLLL